VTGELNMPSRPDARSPNPGPELAPQLPPLFPPPSPTNPPNAPNPPNPPPRGGASMSYPWLAFE
jgi:hypothetical protein